VLLLLCGALTGTNTTLALAGVTRDSIMGLCRDNADLQHKLHGFSGAPMQVTERWVSMPELVLAEKEGRVSE
jgi:hypothetical protein